ncbi:hypothetical protein [Rhizobium sp. CC-YZS058]|uniref:hypothetical protein n=1 Tax=Rhizobium sp. CC-YZS058 TaxID=3042153 RepID=UPI002B05A2DA|nr:hypothetical protein [Rhizobium sp. CC-YZS058]MEA3536556.1 hypothetical protein [Rhizobium sp. CC-YZS058]
MTDARSSERMPIDSRHETIMATAVLLKHPTTGVQKPGYYGFSWTSFFFGGFPALFRGDVAIGFGMLALGFVAGLIGIGFGWFIVSTIWAFLYNKIYTTRLLEAGYKLADVPERNKAAQLALGAGDQALLAPDPA